MASIEVNFDENTVAKLVDERLIAENAELKRLLLLAINDLEFIGSCHGCENESNEDDPHCKNCKNGSRYQWTHDAEAEKLLIGGESDA